MDVRNLLEPFADRVIVAYTEWRQRFQWMPLTLGSFYHAFVMLTVEDTHTICLEKYSDRLELMFGPVLAMQHFAPHFHTNRDRRVASFAKSMIRLQRPIQIREILEWIAGPLAIVWQPYCLVSSNCQHFAEEVYKFLEDPSSAERLKDDPVILKGAITRDGKILRYASQNLRDDKPTVLLAVQQNFEALRYASSRLKGDNDIVKAARGNAGEWRRLISTIELPKEKLFAERVLSIDGMALEFMNDQSKNNAGFVRTAFLQNPVALRFASRRLQRKIQGP